MHYKTIHITLGLLVCALAFSSTQAHQDMPYHASKTPKKTEETKQKVYSYPMHPTVTANKAGKCPKCGMALRPVDHDETSADNASHYVDTSTSATRICPPLGATFARVQKELGDKVGRNVRFISISVDPATDTPERLKAWGAKFHAGAATSFSFR
jgi:hypothetical protein